MDLISDWSPTFGDRATACILLLKPSIIFLINGVSMPLRDDLEKLLDQAGGEREVHHFLKKHPWLIWGMFCNVGGHSDYVLPEFRLRDKFRADFVVMQSYSGAWDVHLIELEPVGSKLFRDSDERPEKRFLGAVYQIEDWKRLIRTEEQTFKNCLADAAMTSDIFQPEHNICSEPSSMAGDVLRNPKTCIWYNYHIVVGRSSELNSHKQYLKSSYEHTNDIRVHTYDRLLRVADAYDSKTPLYQTDLPE
jgi:hypothetical protein